MPRRSLVLLATVAVLGACSFPEDHGKYGRGQVIDDVEVFLPIYADIECDDELELFPENESVTCPVHKEVAGEDDPRVGEVDMVRVGDEVTFSYRPEKPEGGDAKESTAYLDDNLDF